MRLLPTASVLQHSHCSLFFCRAWEACQLLLALGQRAAAPARAGLEVCCETVRLVPPRPLPALSGSEPAPLAVSSLSLSLSFFLPGIGVVATTLRHLAHPTTLLSLSLSSFARAMVKGFPPSLSLSLSLFRSIGQREANLLCASAPRTGCRAPRAPPIAIPHQLFF